MQAFRSQLDNIVWPDPLEINEVDFPAFGEGTFIHVRQGVQDFQPDFGQQETRVFLDVELTVSAQVGAGELERTRLNQLSAEVIRVMEADLTLGLGDAATITGVTIGEADPSLTEGGPRQSAYIHNWTVDFTMPFGDPYTLGA